MKTNCFSDKRSIECVGGQMSCYNGSDDIANTKGTSGTTRDDMVDGGHVSTAST